MKIQQQEKATSKQEKPITCKSHKKNYFYS